VNPILEDFKAIAEVIAYAGAAGFFWWKVTAGYLVVNLGVSIKAERAPASKEEDYLAVALTVKKGAIGSLQLHDVRIRVTYGEEAIDLELLGFERLSFDMVHDPVARRKLNFNRRSTESPFLFLTTDEEATFSAITQVPQPMPCTIEAAVLGVRTSGRRVGRGAHLSYRCLVNIRPPDV
jgi:hypothetical protein